MIEKNFSTKFKGISEDFSDIPFLILKRSLKEVNH